jgi:hypothetical protein
MVERNYKILAHEGARQQDITSLENWVEGTGCLSREETRYLAANDDLLCAATTNDRLLVRLELLLESHHFMLHLYWQGKRPALSFAACG